MSFAETLIFGVLYFMWADLLPPDRMTTKILFRVFGSVFLAIAAFMMVAK